jgi:P4 family phage/plasmid primase-like protien
LASKEHIAEVVKPRLEEHLLTIVRVGALLSENKGLKAWPAPFEGLVDHWSDAKYLEAMPHVRYDESHVSYRMHIMSTLMHLQCGYEWLIDALRGKPGFDAEYIRREWDEVLESNSGPRYYTQMKAVRLPDVPMCEYEHEVTAPIRIPDEKRIESEPHGFWEMKVTKEGELVPVRPLYRDLMKKFNQDHPFVTLSDSTIVYIFEDTHYKSIEPAEIKGYAEEHFNPKPKSSNQRKEFLETIRVNNLRTPDWLNYSADGMINLKNGIYNIKTGDLRPHSPEYAFRYVLPYDYDPSAECPRFEKFLLEVTKDRIDIVSVLQEFMGYAVAGGPCYGEKALIMYGEGANGKSTFMDVLKAMAGSDNYSALSLSALQKDTKRYQVDGKLFNIGEETSVTALGKSEVFKTMVTGGEIDVKKLYVQDYSFKNKCKLIMACNELPKSSDRSDGLYRRMILVPFDAKFEGKTKDPFIREKLYAELPGIFNFAMQGYRRLLENNYQFTDSHSLTESLDEYKMENDNVFLWVKDNLSKGDSDTWEWKDDIYNSYKKQMQEDSEYIVNKRVFFKTLYRVLPGVEEKKKTDTRGFDTKRKRILTGIRME